VTFAVFDAGRALNVVGSPVNGLTPSRALRAFTFLRLTLLKPGRIVTGSARRVRQFSERRLELQQKVEAGVRWSHLRFSTPRVSPSSRIRTASHGPSASDDAG
jgi:hypothetical protein